MSISQSSSIGKIISSLMGSFDGGGTTIGCYVEVDASMPPTRLPDALISPPPPIIVPPSATPTNPYTDSSPEAEYGEFLLEEYPLEGFLGILSTHLLG